MLGGKLLVEVAVLLSALIALRIALHEAVGRLLLVGVAPLRSLRRRRWRDLGGWLVLLAALVGAGSVLDHIATLTLLVEAYGVDGVLVALLAFACLLLPAF